MDAVGYALAQTIPSRRGGFGSNGVYRANISPQRTNHAAGLLPNGSVLTVAGFTSSSSKVTNVSAYDPVANTWTAKATIPGSGGRCMGVNLSDGRIFVLDEDKYPRIYTPGSNTWETKTRNPSSDAVIVNPGIAQVPDGRIVLIGNEWSASGAVWLYNLAADSWASGTTKPEDRTATATTLPDGTVFTVRNSEPLSVRTYDPVANTWTAKATNPTFRWNPASVSLSGGDVLLLGGTNNSSVALNTGDIYRYATNTWEVAGANLAEGHSHVPATLLDDGKTIFIAGTYNSNAGWNKTELIVTNHSLPDTARAAILAYLASK